MLLENKHAVIYGAGGSIGGTVARVFADEGATVFLAGRTLSALERIAEEISATGGSVETAEVDALDEQAVERHLDDVVGRTGGVDVSFNAISIRGELQGTPLIRMALEDFRLPITMGVETHFLTAGAAARHMVERGSGVILTLTASASRLAGPLMGGFGVACAAIESFTRCLAGEVGPQGVRVVGLRSEGIPETWNGEFRDHVFDPPGDGYGAGMSRRELQAHLEGMTMLRRLPTLAELANVAAFVASDHASAITGSVANLTCGSVAD